MINVTSITTSEIGDLVRIQSLLEELLQEVQVEDVYNRTSKLYEKVVHLGDQMVHSDLVSDILIRLKEYE